MPETAASRRAGSPIRMIHVLAYLSQHRAMLSPASQRAAAGSRLDTRDQARQPIEDGIPPGSSSVFLVLDAPSEPVHLEPEGCLPQPHATVYRGVVLLHE